MAVGEHEITIVLHYTDTNGEKGETEEKVTIMIREHEGPIEETPEKKSFDFTNIIVPLIGIIILIVLLDILWIIKKRKK